MFIVGSYDIGILCSKMQIQDNEEVYDTELKKNDFESQGERHEERSKVVPHLRRA